MKSKTRLRKKSRTKKRITRKNNKMRGGFIFQRVLKKKIEREYKNTWEDLNSPQRLMDNLSEELKELKQSINMLHNDDADDPERDKLIKLYHETVAEIKDTRQGLIDKLNSLIDHYIEIGGTFEQLDTNTNANKKKSNRSVTDQF